MKESKFTEEQIIAILREAERGEQTIVSAAALMALPKTLSTSGDRSSAAWRFQKRGDYANSNVRTPA